MSPFSGHSLLPDSLCRARAGTSVRVRAGSGRSELLTERIDAVARNLKLSIGPLVGGVAAIEGIDATDQVFVPLSLLIDEQGTVLELISGWSAETQQRFSQLAGAQ